MKTRIGVAAVIHRPRRGISGLLGSTEVLLLLRQGSAGDGTWAPPGGAVELEDVARGGDVLGETAQREVMEEVGLRVRPLPHGRVTVGHITNGQPWVCVFIPCELADDSVPRICEPTKAAALRWFPPSALPSPLFEPANAPGALTRPGP